MSSDILAIRREDGTTAAERLFGDPFPDLFEWIVEHMGELPLHSRAFRLRWVAFKGYSSRVHGLGHGLAETAN